MKLIIFTDGGSRGNPGPAAVGIVIQNEQGGVLKRYGEAIGAMTNNEAEYNAVIFALKKVKLLFGKSKTKQIEIEMRLDSELVVKQLNHEYKIMEENLEHLFVKVWNLMMDFKVIKFKHISREKNTEADRLVNEALNRKEEVGLPGL